MSYTIHWQSTAISKNGNTYQLDIYEKDFSGDIINIPVSVNPFVIKANASSDNQYEPILASELRVHLDITDHQYDFIDFSNEDQFRYFGKLTYSGNIVFQGWLLPDAMTTPFTTGRIECNFSFIDGLAMLKTIYYTPTNLNSTILENVRQTITNCLNALNYPFGFNINIAVSIFATAMNNRTANIQNDPMSQGYMWVSNWFNSQQITTPNIDPYYFSDYISCYEILNYLMLGWGCQLFQANGEWVVANVNEMAGENIYLTKFDNTGTIVSASNKLINYTVKPYNTNGDLYFVDNTQAKILRQGFSQIYFKTPSQFPINAIDNGYLRRTSGGGAVNWLANSYLTGNVTFNIGDVANYYELSYSPIGSFDSYALIKPTSTQELYYTDTIHISFNYKITNTPIADKPICYIRLELVDGATTYYYSNNKKWEVMGATPNYYQVTGDLTELQENSFTLDAPNIPTNGQYYFWIYIQPPTLGYPQTQSSVQFSRFAVTYSNKYSYNLISFQKNENYQNRKTVDGYVGAGFINDFNATGAVINSFGHYAYDIWYRQSEGYLTHSQQSLLAVVAEDYYFTQSKAQINVEGSLMSLMSNLTRETTPTHISLFSSFKIQDITTGPNSLTGRYYTLGNCEFDLINDVMNNVTLLEISNTRLDSTSKNIDFTVTQ